MIFNISSDSTMRSGFRPTRRGKFVLPKEHFFCNAELCSTEYFHLRPYDAIQEHQGGAIAVGAVGGVGSTNGVLSPKCGLLSYKNRNY